MENTIYKSTCKTCRTCSQSFSRKLLPLFKEENKLTMIFVHSKEYNIKITRNDGLPQNICSECLKELSRINNFLKKCMESEQVLLKKYKKTDTCDTASDLNTSELKIEYTSDHDENIEEDYYDKDNKKNKSNVRKATQLSIENLESEALQVKAKDKNQSDDYDNSVKEEFLSETIVDIDVNDIKSDVEEYYEDTLENSDNKICESGKSNKRNLRSSIKLSSNEKEKYICEPCDEIFDNLSEYKSHRKIHPKSKKYVRETFLCDLCGIEFVKQENFQNHQNKHLGIKPYKCEVCDKEFAAKKTFKAHFAKHSKKETFTCEICGKIYTTKNNYDEHLIRHEKGSVVKNNQASFKCPHCPRSFILLSTLKAHCSFHNKTADRKYLCTECNTTFKRSDHLKEHINRVHLKILPFKCDVCSKCFITGAIRNEHARKYHSGIRHKCDICEKDFSLLNSLRKHKRRHTGDKRYVCEICNMSFMAIREIKRHMETHKIDETTKNNLISKTYEEITRVVTETI